MIQTWNFDQRCIILMCFSDKNLGQKYALRRKLFAIKISIFPTLTASRRPTGGPSTSSFSTTEFFNETNNPWKLQVCSISRSDFRKKSREKCPFLDQKWRRFSIADNFRTKNATNFKLLSQILYITVLLWLKFGGKILTLSGVIRRQNFHFFDFDGF